MSEVSFAKSFLATLDKRPIKLPGDHAGDPRKYPNTSPYVLPKQTHPFPRRGPATTTQTKPKSITVALKPMRAGETVKLPDISLDTSVHDVKTQYASQANLSLDKIRILLNKKPAADLKTLKDLGVDGDVEFGVMLMGGGGGAAVAAASPATTEKANESAATTATTTAAATKVADEMEIDPQGSAPDSEKAQAEASEQHATSTTETTAREMLRTEDFWRDIEDFLVQRLRDQGEGQRLARLFREAAAAGGK